MEIFIRGLVGLGITLALASIGFSHEPGGCAACGDSAAQRLLGHDGGLFGRPHYGLFHRPDPVPPHQPAARTQPGTVVFPQHPFVRSPRDFFMVD